MTTRAIIVMAAGTLADVPAGDDWLHPDERRLLDRLAVARRRVDWRLGRFTMKRLLADRLPARPALARLAVLPAADGAPVAFLDGAPLAVRISISHRVGVALCAASDQVVHGCDVELVEPRSDEFVDDWFTAAERSLVCAVASRERPLVANAIWSCKESAAKALRVGLRVDTRELEVRIEPAPRDGWGRVTVACSGRELPGRWRREGDLVLSVVAAPDAGAARQNATPMVIGISCSPVPKM